MSKLRIVFTFRLLVMACCMFTVSCTDVDLCLETVHPHRASVAYRFNWASYNYHPDSMLVLANRVVNMWKGAMCVNSTDGTGVYLYNTQVDNAAVENTDTDDAGTGDSSELEDNEMAATRADEGNNSSVSEFRIPTGDYKFITFNRNFSELDYSRLEEYYVDPAMPLHDITISYKIMSRESRDLRHILKDWTDWNPYAWYIQPSSEAIFYDTVSVRKLKANQLYTVTFRPKPLTQHIRIIFDIEKVASEVPFTIDSVFAEVSGIPLSVDLSTGYVDIRQTGKMMYRTELLSANGSPLSQDTETNTKLRCQKDINVPGIVRSEDNTVMRGPGIMQVYIMASTKEPKRRKKFQGVINLYATLTEADLIHYTPDRQHAVPWGDNKTLFVRLKTPLLIDGKNILENPDDGSGLDVWKEVEAGEEIVVDI